MSDPFTTPADGSWQELLDEIVLAYSERRQVLGQSAYVAADDKDVQAASYWTTLQAWLETNCVVFIDHDNGPLTDDEDDFLYFTLDNWRSAAGLNANGFRRKYGPKGALVEAYGQMQEGDVIGPWIFEDLQKGFGALKWIMKRAKVKDEWEKIASANGAICEAVRAEAIANFTAVDPVLNPDTSHFYYVFVTSSSFFNFGARRIQGTAYVSEDFNAAVPYICDFYGFVHNPNPDHFYDGDGLGLIADKLFNCGTVAESQEATCELENNLVDINAEPFTPFGLNCPLLSDDVFKDVSIIFYVSEEVSYGGALFKYNFTNA